MSRFLWFTVYIIVDVNGGGRQLSAHSEKRVQSPNPIPCIKA